MRGVNVTVADCKHREVPLALTRLLLYAPSKILMILASGTKRRLLRRLISRLVTCGNQRYDCRIREAASMIGEELASYGELSIAVSAPVPFVSLSFMFVTSVCI